MPKTDIKKTMMKTAYLEADIPTTELGEFLPQPTAGAPGGSAPREIGVDEAGRGPMFGRVYTAAVILPTATAQAQADGFKYEWMKDSKKFHSEKKIREVAAYIKENAIAWAIAYADETVIDTINIRNATHKAMHEAIGGCTTLNNTKIPQTGVAVAAAKPLMGGQGGNTPLLLLIDGNDFTPYIDVATKQRVQHVCIEGGDNTYSSIAAASILAKVARDDYIAELCAAQPELIAKYDLLKNKGYGTKKHMEGIKTHGITANHRKTFGICREFA